MTPWIDLFIVALLPLTALFTVLQPRPYHALVSRGIMGIAAVLLYAVLGAPDVALTEALVGTLLTITLYAITVRSTRVLRVGRLVGAADPAADSTLRQFCSCCRLALRTLAFPDEQQLIAALRAGEIDAVLMQPDLIADEVTALPSGWPDGRLITLLAPHGRWHERRLKALFGEQEPVMRLEALNPGGAES